MSLDVPTLMIAGGFVAFLSGTLLVGAWYQFNRMWSALWWAASDFTLAISVVLLTLGLEAGSPLMIVPALCGLALQPALVWHAARLFAGRRPNYWLVVLAPLLIAAAGAVPSGALRPVLVGMTASVVGPVFYVAAAWTIFRHRSNLVTRLPLVGFLLLHAGVTALGLTANIQPGAEMAPVGSLYGLIHFEALIFLIGSTIFVVAGMHEANEQGFKRLARFDDLTGLLNRRGFFEDAAPAALDCGSRGVPVTVLVLDLDHFKAVNDGHGHAMGDEVLKLFADVARKALRPADILGRTGGEEFAALLPGAGIEAALAIAERVRKAFEVAGMFVAGQRLNVTVSLGVASTISPPLVLDALIADADAALYQAKAAGRNRVAAAGLDGPTTPPSRILRIA